MTPPWWQLCYIDIRWVSEPCPQETAGTRASHSSQFYHVCRGSRPCHQVYWSDQTGTDGRLGPNRRLDRGSEIRKSLNCGWIHDKTVLQSQFVFDFEQMLPERMKKRRKQIIAQFLNIQARYRKGLWAWMAEYWVSESKLMLVLSSGKRSGGILGGACWGWTPGHPCWYGWEFLSEGELICSQCA